MIDAGNLRARYDVLVFVDSGLTGGGGGGGRGGGRGGGGAGAGRGAGAAQARDPRDDRPPSVAYSEEFTRRRGGFSAESLAQVKQFVEAGGTVIAIGGAAQNAVDAFELPLSDHLEGLSRAEYYVPGSVLRVQVDPTDPLAHGYGTEADIYFANSPTWKINPGATNVKRVAWFATDDPLRSGWAWGQSHLKDGVQMARASIGQGFVYLFANDLLFRTQPHGSFRFFFNGLYLSVAPEVK
jgi:hypothetical protein